MATHSSVLVWRISGTEEPGGLPSIGSQRIGHSRATKHRHRVARSLPFVRNVISVKHNKPKCYTTRYECVSVCVICSVVSNSLQPQGLYPTRLLCPCKSPGKNTGVGSHSLLQGIFPTKRLNPGHLHGRQILYCLSHHGNPQQGMLVPK